MSLVKIRELLPTFVLVFKTVTSNSSLSGCQIFHFFFLGCADLRGNIFIYKICKEKLVGDAILVSLAPTGATYLAYYWQLLPYVNIM